ncbi:hypothetical protein C0030_003615 [Candidatus Liberibacter solanacearum]|uniref:Integrase n=1 Tax=Candidatus Liberibacter solanacearum TaxID=556287 RepID=A0A3R7Q3R5_9HYPH|nr:hypothetical protein [Candidatus Liberibacter solanacearum]RPD37199.1 hypothetical protein C0030_003615 [Candidatus Liberibacter solanacearum]
MDTLAIIAIRRLDSVGVDGDTFLTSSPGKPFSSPDSFGNWFKIKCKEAKLPLEYTVHGLRKAETTIIANAGASPHDTDGKKWKWLN